MIDKNENIVIKSAEKSKNHEIMAKGRIGRFFKFNDFNTTFKKEIIGGISTFLAMVYILSVAPNILGDAKSIDGINNMNKDGVFLATIIVTFISTMIMGLSANIPCALSVGMGANAMFTYTVANSANLGYEGALVATMLSGILLCIISVSNLRKMLIISIPKSIHGVIGIGIGFFIAYVGIADIGIVAKTDVPTAKLNSIKDNYLQMLIGLAVAFGAVFLYYRKKFAPIAITMLSAFVLVIILAYAIPKNILESNTALNFLQDVKWDSNKLNYLNMFKGFSSNIKSTFNAIGNTSLWTNPSMYISIFVFTILGFFDATGALTAMSIDLNKNTLKKRELSGAALIIDSAASVGGSIIGVSHINCFVESGAGIAQGARTGFSAIITACMILISIVLFPLFAMLPSCISGAATLFIGILMISNITEIEWSKPEISFAGFMVILIMITTYNISNGIAIGLLAYTIGACACKRTKEISLVIWITDLVFIAYFVSFAFIQ